jgi:hypothetical protein
MARRDGVAHDEFKMASIIALITNPDFKRCRYGRFEDVVNGAALWGFDV